MSCGGRYIDVPSSLPFTNPLTSPGGLLSLQLLGRLGFFPQLKISLLKNAKTNRRVFFPETIGLNYTVFVKKQWFEPTIFCSLYEKPCFFFCSFVRWGGGHFWSASCNRQTLVSKLLLSRRGNSWIRSSSFGFQGGEKKKSKKYEQTQIRPGIVETKGLYIWILYTYMKIVCIYIHMCFNIMFFSYNTCNNIHIYIYLDCISASPVYIMYAPGIHQTLVMFNCLTNIN